MSNVETVLAYKPRKWMIDVIFSLQTQTSSVISAAEDTLGTKKPRPPSQPNEDEFFFWIFSSIFTTSTQFPGRSLSSMWRQAARAAQDDPVYLQVLYPADECFGRRCIWFFLTFAFFHFAFNRPAIVHFKSLKTNFSIRQFFAKCRQNLQRLFIIKN